MDQTQVCSSKSHLIHIGTKRVQWTVLIVIIYIHLAHGSECHTLEFQYTVHISPNSPPEFHQATLFDGQVIFYCNSSTFRDQPRQSWITDTFTPKELSDRHVNCRREYNEHLEWYKEINETLNASTETLQRRRGCILNESGIFSFDQWAVNGEDFLTFEPKQKIWTPAIDLAASVALEWNKRTDRNQARNNAYKQFGKKMCTKYNSEFKQKSGTHLSFTALEVYVFAKPILESTVTSLKCHVTYSKLSEVKIQLIKNKVPLNHGIRLTGPLPNGDGTFQMRLQTELSLMDSEGYSCHVQSDKTQKSVSWDGLTQDKISPPVQHLTWEDWKTLFFGVLIVVLVISVFILYLKRKQSQQRIRDEKYRIHVITSRSLLLLMANGLEAFDERIRYDDEFYGRRSRNQRLAQEICV